MTRIDWEAVRARHSMVSVARRSGLDVPETGDVTICCPMAAHDDSTPSMVVHLDTDRYHCFGCEATGDVIQWVRDLQGCAAAEAVQVLDSGRDIDAADHDGSPRPVAADDVTARPRTEEPDLGRTSPERVQAAVETAWGYYTFGTLHDRGVAYLAGRGIDVTALEAETGTREVGHTPGGPTRPRPTGLVERLGEKGFSVDELVDAGLAARYPDGRVTDSFRYRAMLPVTDNDGRVTGLIGRYTGAGKAPKYLNMRRTHTYDKSVSIYRPSRAALSQHANVVVVEGVLDALAVASQAATSGLSHLYAPVCTSGLGLSASQVQQVLALHPGPPVIAGDGDTAGRQRANLKWATAVLAAGRESVVVDWPDGTDPASWLSTHGEAGLIAITRKGCLHAPTGQVRPQHVGTVITQTEAAAIPDEWDGKRTAAITRLVEGVTHHAAKLPVAGAERYAKAAISIVVPLVVDVAIDVSTDSYGNIDRVVQTVAKWGTALPTSSRQAFARHAADALESRDLGAAGWLERKLHAAIEVKTYDNRGGGTEAGFTADYDLGTVAR
ncbi:MAG: CHC2 zinc finger domain-containing protein [Acidimicrobiales bacterium]